MRDLQPNANHKQKIQMYVSTTIGGIIILRYDNQYEE